MNKVTPPLRASVISALRAQLRGTAILPGEAGYDDARRVWNAAIDRRPAAVVSCADAEDAGVALKIASDNGVQVTVRGGGHNVAGRSILDGVLMLDLSRLRAVAVNSNSRIASVQGGCLWRDVDAATAKENLATTGGLVSSTGVGGLTLGGGVGWLMRKHGLAIDNLVSANVALADGRFVRASAHEYPDLFWGLRGGGGGLGVVTSFEFRLHPVQNVLAGLVVYSADNAKPVLAAFRDFAVVAPDEFCGLAAVLNAPPLPFLDAVWHGRPVVILAVCWAGDIAVGERVLKPLRGFGPPLADHMGPMPYVQWQQMQDPGAPAGRINYWKNANYEALSDSVLDQIAAAAHDLPSPQTEIHVQHMGGAVARVAAGDSAFAQRNARFFVNVIGAAPTPDMEVRLRERVRALHERIAREALPSAQTNFSGADENPAVRRLGAESAARLEGLQRRHDPAGTFATL